MQYSGFMGLLFRIAHWFMQFSVVNVTWVLVNSLTFVLVFLLFLSPSVIEMIIFAVLLLISVSAILVPSSVALFAVAREWLIRHEDTTMVQAFWGYLKENYKQSIRSGVVLSLLWTVWLVDFLFFLNRNDLLTMVLVIVGVYLYVYSIVYFSMAAHFQMSVKKLLAQAFFLTVGRPLLAIGIVFISGSLFYFSLQFSFLFVFFTISINAYLCFYLFFRFTGSKTTA